VREHGKKASVISLSVCIAETVETGTDITTLASKIMEMDLDDVTGMGLGWEYNKEKLHVDGDWGAT
jgi:hypothetical protein